MTSDENKLIRSHFRIDGIPKRSYLTMQDARDRAFDLNKEYYKCDFCDWWHLGGDRG